MIQIYTPRDLDQTLKELKICHNNYLLIIKNSALNVEKIFKENEPKLNTNIMDKYIGLDFQPISLTIILNNKDHKYKTYNNINLSELKNGLQKQFNFSYNISIKLKNEHKSINLDDIEFDRKNKIPLNLKQMKVTNDSILVISRNQEINNNDNESKENLDLNSISISNVDNNPPNKIKVSNIVCLEDDRNDVRIISFNLKKSFEDFIKKIKKIFSLEEEIIIRLRK